MNLLLHLGPVLKKSGCRHCQLMRSCTPFSGGAQGGQSRRLAAFGSAGQVKVNALERGV